METELLLDIIHIYPCFIRDQYPYKELESLCTYHYYCSYDDNELYKNRCVNPQTYEIKWKHHIFNDLFNEILQTEVKEQINTRIEFIHKLGKEYFKNKFFKMVDLFELLENEWKLVPRKQFIRSIYFTYANQPILRILLKPESQMDSPKSVSSTNSPYVKHIIEENQDDEYIWGSFDDHISIITEKNTNRKKYGFLSMFKEYPKPNQDPDMTDVFIDIYDYDTKKNTKMEKEMMNQLLNKNSCNYWNSLYQLTNNISNYTSKIIPFTLVGIYLGISIYNRQYKKT